MNILLCCPKCKGNLEKDNQRLVCFKCDQYYPVLDGIVSFSTSNKFYDGKFTYTHTQLYSQKEASGILKQGLIWLYENFSQNYFERRMRFLKKNIPDKGLILDLGCGGGIASLVKPDREVIGVDISLPSLKKAMKIYSEVYQTDVTTLPFAAATFDCIIASELLGHLEPGDKQKLLGEIYRVLKADGKVLLTLETQGALRNWAKRLDENLYQKYLVEQYGHFGLEAASKMLKLVSEGPWRTKKIKKTLSYVWPSLQVKEAFNNEYIAKNKKLKLWVKTVETFYPKPAIREIFDLVTGLIGNFIDYMVSLDKACELYLVLEKKGE